MVGIVLIKMSHDLVNERMKELEFFVDVANKFSHFVCGNDGNSSEINEYLVFLLGLIEGMYK